MERHSHNVCMSAALGLTLRDVAPARPQREVTGGRLAATPMVRPVRRPRGQDIHRRSLVQPVNSREGGRTWLRSRRAGLLASCPGTART